MMSLKVFFLLIMLNVGLIYSQTEYHFYSDQPESHRIRPIDNEYSYSSSQIKDKLYVNLKVYISKKKISSGQSINFLVTLTQSGTTVNRQVVTDTYYDYDGKYYSFKLPISVENLDSASVQISNQSPEILGNVELVFPFVSEKQSGGSVYLLNSNLEPIITNQALVGQVVVPSSNQKRLYLRFFEYDTQKTALEKDPKPRYGVPTIKTVASEASFYLAHKGFYEFALDSTFTNPKTIMVVDNTFPKINKAKELLKPLIYLTDSASYNALLGSDAPKMALDEFWLKFAGNNTTLAKKIIKLYYQRVYHANEKYNHRIQGWKSDMGMAYILFGKPKDASTEGNTITWHYEQGLEIKFVKNNFGEFDFSNIQDISSHIGTALENIKTGNID